MVSKLRGSNALIRTGLVLALVAGLMVVEGVSQGQDTEQTAEELLPVARAPHSPTKLQIGQPTFMEAGDFDEDGNVDLILVTLTPVEEAPELIWKARVVLLSSDGKGGYGSPKLLHEVEHCPEPLGGLALAVDDLDLDGHLDFAVTNIANGGVWILLGNGAGEFTKELLQPGIRLTYSPILSADLNGDRYPDLLAPELISRSVYVLWGGGEDEFGRVSVYSLDKRSIPLILAKGDFDEDGYVDAAVEGWRWTEEGKAVYFVAILSTRGGEELELLSITDVGKPAPPETIALAVGDYDRNGHLDLVVVRHQHLYILWGDGKGTFRVEEGYPVFDPVVTQIILADIDQDGCLNDIVVGGTTGRVWISTGCYGEERYILPILLQGWPRSGVVTDVDNNGVPDLVIATSMWPDWTYLELLLGK